MTHRALTEGGPYLSRVTEIASRLFPDGFSLWTGEGYWKGNREDTCCIEVMGTTLEMMKEFAHEIKRTCHQQSVLVQQVQNHHEFV